MEKQRGKRQAEVTLKDGNLLTKKDTTGEEETAAEKFISFTAAGLIRPFFKEMGDFSLTCKAIILMFIMTHGTFKRFLTSFHCLIMRATIVRRQ